MQLLTRLVHGVRGLVVRSLLVQSTSLLQRKCVTVALSNYIRKYLADFSL